MADVCSYFVKRIFYLKSVRSLDYVLNSSLVNVAALFPLDGITGCTVGEGEAAIKLSLEDIAEIRCAGSNSYFLACINRSLKSIVDRVYAVVSGCAELVEGLAGECSLILCDVLCSLILKWTGYVGCGLRKSNTGSILHSLLQWAGLTP